MPRNWYSIKAIAETKSAEINLFDVVGRDTSARKFVDELKSLDAYQIDLHINSPGGSVFEGVAIQNALKNHPANVTTYIDGVAGSIASIIALAGDEVRIADNAYVMIHNPSSMVLGESKDMRKEAEVLDKLTEGLAADYSRKMGITTDEARELMANETWYLGAEAVDAGYADSIFEGSRAAASFDLSRFSNRAPQGAIDKFTNVASSDDGIFTPSGNLDPKEDDPMSDETTPVETTENLDQTPDAVEQVETPATPVAEIPDVQAAVQEALINERKRTAELTSLGSKFGFGEDSEKFIADGKSIAEFQAHILNKSPDDWRNSLAIKNPAQLSTESDDADEGSEAVARIRERRKAKFGVA